MWVSPAGHRIEVAPYGDGWRTYTYTTRRGGAPAAVHDFDTEAQVRDATSRLEQDQGYQRQPDREPDGARSLGEKVGREWRSPAQWIAAVVVLAVVVVLIVVLSSGD